MAALQRIFMSALAMGCLMSAPAIVGAQARGAAPDTAAAHRVVDSLVRAGAWRMPTPDTVHLRPDTVRTSLLDSGLHLSAFVAGIIVLGGLGWTTVLFARRFFSAIDGRASIGVRGHWGGFGGSESGWEASAALALLGLTVAFAILTTIVASTLLGAAGTGDRPAAAAPAAAHDSAAKK